MGPEVTAARAAQRRHLALDDDLHASFVDNLA